MLICQSKKNSLLCICQTDSKWVEAIVSQRNITKDTLQLQAFCSVQKKMCKVYYAEGFEENKKTNMSLLSNTLKINCNNIEKYILIAYNGTRKIMSNLHASYDIGILGIPPYKSKNEVMTK